MVPFMETINAELIDDTLLKTEICMISTKHLLAMTICTAMLTISKLIWNFYRGIESFALKEGCGIGVDRQFYLVGILTQFFDLQNVSQSIWCIL